MMEQTENQKVVSIGGLNSSINHIQLSDNEPGSGIELQNFETSLYGGYRRLSGFEPLSPGAENVDTDNAEGRILLVAFYGDQIIVARKQKSGNTYKFYVYTGTSWVVIPGQPVMDSSNVTRIRWRLYNFKGTDEIAFVDGVNKMTIWNGVDWTQVDVANTGADYAHAGGNQAINNPRYITTFKNTLWMAENNLVIYSAPLTSYDWTAASGSGQLPVGFVVQNIYPFRDTLYVFGENNIKKIVLQQATDSTGADTSYFAVQDVTNNIGLIAADSIQEINGDLIFLSQDGFRPVEGTARIGDVELETISKKVQQLVTSEIQGNDMEELCSVIVRNKSQVRFFFSSPVKSTQETFGIIGCLRDNQQGGPAVWEWFRVKGINASATASRYIGNTEYIIHGDYAGNVYRQEQGNSFNGLPIEAIYSTPFLDFGAPGVRKTMRKMRLFIRPEGNIVVGMKLNFDWLDPEKINPAVYPLSQNYSDTSIYDVAIYDIGLYGSLPVPVLVSNVQGSGWSTQIKFTTSDTNAAYTIQGMLYEFSVEGKK